MFALKLAIVPALLAYFAVAEQSIHLINCFNGSQPVSSVFAYYINNSTSGKKHNYPDDIAVVDSSFLVEWEANRWTGTFNDTQRTFTTYIDSQGQPGDVGSFQGIGYEAAPLGALSSVWNCFRDDNDQLYFNGTDACASIYYCEPSTPYGST